MDIKPDYRQTEVRGIPTDWDWKAIGSIAIIYGGGTPSTSIYDYWDGPIPWVSAGDVSRTKSRFILDTSNHITELGLASCPARTMSKGTIVIIARGATVGGMAQLGRAMAFNQTCYGLQPISGIDINYLYYAMLFSVNSMKALTYGTVFGTITTNSFDQWKIPIPPTLAEQEAIAEALSDADALIESLEQLIAKKRLIKQGTMQELLTGKKRLSGFRGEWKRCYLADIGKFFKGKGIKKDEVTRDGIPCIRYGEIYTHYNDFIRNFISFIPRETTKQSQRIHKGDILFTGSGETAEEIGKCVAFLGNEEAYAGGDIVIFRPESQDSKFLGYLMNHSSIKVQKARMGQGDAIVHISSQKLGQLELHLPTTHEQITIANLLSDIDAEITALEEKLAKTRQIKQGMMQELLTGKTRMHQD